MDTTKASQESCVSNRRRFTQTQRAAHLAAWSRSGLRAADYGSEHGVSVASLYAWRHAACKQTQPPAQKSPFVPVRISGLPTAPSNLRVTFRLGEFECAAEGQDPRTLAIWAANLKREVFDV